MNTNLSKLSDFVIEQINDHNNQMKTMSYTGGQQRKIRGEFVENLVGQVIEKICNYIGLQNYAVKYREKLMLKSVNGYTKSHGVDVHVYIHDEFALAIECKSYLDACYYDRACVDLHLIKQYCGSHVKTMIVSLENSIEENTKLFYDDLFNEPVDNVCLLSSYTRSSKIPFWQRYSSTQENTQYINAFLETLYSIISASSIPTLF